MANEKKQGGLEQDNQTEAKNEPARIKETKFTLIYAEMHKRAAKNPNTKLVYTFSDAEDTVIKFLDGKFEEHPDLIPHNITLRFKKRDGSELNKIEGLGLIDEDYAQSVEKIGEIFQEITAKNRVLNQTSQHAINTGLMYKPIDEFGEFKKWRREQNQNRGAKRSEIAALEADFDQTVTASNTVSNESKCVDATKFTLLYARMHELAAKNSDKKVTYNFPDDTDMIINFLHGKFEDYPDLIPHNVNLQFKKTGSASQLGTIQGVGPIDENYVKSIEEIVKISQLFTTQAPDLLAEVKPTLDQMSINSSLDDFKTWRSQQPAVKIATLQFEIATLKTDFDETVQRSTSLSKKEMNEKFTILINNLKSEINSLNTQLEIESNEYRADYSKIEKKIDDLLKTVAAVKTFVKDGLKSLAQGIPADKGNPENAKKSVNDLAQKLKKAEDRCKNEVMKLSVSQQIKTGLSAFVGAVGLAMLGFVAGLILGGPIGALAGAIEGGKFGFKEGEKLSFRGHPVKTAAKDFVESTRAATKPIEPTNENSSGHRPN